MPVWQQACAEPSKLPDRAMFLAQQMSGAAAVMPPGAHHPGMVISEPIPGAKPLALPPELAALRASGAIGQQVGKTHTCPGGGLCLRGGLARARVALASYGFAKGHFGSKVCIHSRDLRVPYS